MVASWAVSDSYHSLATSHYRTQTVYIYRAYLLRFFFIPFPSFAASRRGLAALSLSLSLSAHSPLPSALSFALVFGFFRSEAAFGRLFFGILPISGHFVRFLGIFSVFAGFLLLFTLFW